MTCARETSSGGSSISWIQRGTTLGAAALWVGLIVSGLCWMNVYAATPGDMGEPPNMWPAATQLVDPGQAPLLLVFSHPDCPCTQATLRNLQRLRTRTARPLDVRVVFFDAPQTRDVWADTTLKRQAARMDGVEIVLDDQGIEAARFGVRTSGHVLLYAPDQSLVFSGGVTPSRGHEGASPGLEAIELWIQTQTLTLQDSLVYGCPLCEATPATDAEKREP